MWKCPSISAVLLACCSMALETSTSCLNCLRMCCVMTSISTKWMSSSLTLPPNYSSPGAHSPWPPPCLDHSCPRRWPSSPRPQSLPASTATPLSALAYIPYLCRHMPSHTPMIALSQMQHFLHQLRPGMAPLGPCCGTRLLSPFSELL